MRCTQGRVLLNTELSTYSYTTGYQSHASLTDNWCWSTGNRGACLSLEVKSIQSTPSSQQQRHRHLGSCGTKGSTRWHSHARNTHVDTFRCTTFQRRQPQHMNTGKHHKHNSTIYMTAPYLCSVLPQWTSAMSCCSLSAPQQWHVWWRHYWQSVENDWRMCWACLQSVAQHCQCCTLLGIAMGHTWRRKEHLRRRDGGCKIVWWGGGGEREEGRSRDIEEDCPCNIHTLATNMSHHIQGRKCKCAFASGASRCFHCVFHTVWLPCHFRGWLNALGQDVAQHCLRWVLAKGNQESSNNSANHTWKTVSLPTVHWRRQANVPSLRMCRDAHYNMRARWSGLP